jgi:hypothetical protein
MLCSRGVPHAGAQRCLTTDGEHVVEAERKADFGRAVDLEADM